MSELPAGWTKTALGNVATIERSMVEPTVLDPDTPYLGLEHIEAGGRLLGGSTTSRAEVRSSKVRFAPAHVLVGKLRPYLAKITTAPFSGVASTDILPVEPSKHLDQRYLLYYLRQPQVIKKLNAMSAGANLPRLSPKSLAGLDIPLPPLGEQRRIAAILDRASELRQVVDRALDRLDVIEDAAFIKTFGSPRTWSARWHMGTIGDLATSVQYGTSAKAGAYGEYKMLRMGNITMRGRLDLTDLKYIDLPAGEVTKFTTRRGDLLFNRTNSFEQVGKTGLVDTDEPMAIAGYLVRLRLHESLAPEFVGAYLNSTYGRNLRQNRAKLAVNQANINATQLKQLPIAVPPHGIQQEFQHIVGAIDDQRRSWHKTRQTLDTLIASLQSRAFRGEL